MTINLALEYIPQRMCELGFGTDYFIRVRHFVLQPLEERQIETNNQVFILVEPFCDLKIESTAGMFDLSETIVDELQYEHRGSIKLKNYSIFINHIRFVQVIPKFCKKTCP